MDAEVFEVRTGGEAKQMTNESVLLQDLRQGLCSSGLCKQLRSVAADEIELLRDQRDTNLAKEVETVQRLEPEIERLRRENAELIHDNERLMKSLNAEVNAHEPCEYRKWPGEPPHCMSCDCGMTDEQKRTVPFEDYQTFHVALMKIKYESVSLADAQVVALLALQRPPTAEKSDEGAPRGAGSGAVDLYAACTGEPHDCPYIYCHSQLKCAKEPVTRT